ncbi:MAG: phage shock protein PspA [Gammaproteobacteria bacterium]|nr:phage shock protein PspA [Gammaproteobacteria bacterium]
MGIFSRFSDIINANINAMLDKAEDPKKLIRLLIQEMEETLVELRSGAAKHIAQRKQLEAQLQRANSQLIDWAVKAQLAVNKGRDDLARSALIQKQQAAERVATLEQDLDRYNVALSSATEDATRLEQKMQEARTRQQALMARHTQAKTRIKVKEQLASHKIDDAILRFESFEKKVVALESEVESYELGQSEQSVAAQFKQMEQDDAIEQQLNELKQRVAS